MRSQAIIQIILVVLSLVMIFTIIRPMLGGIRDEQNEVQRFKEAVNAADQFNARLGDLLARANGFGSSDLAALDLYLPSEIDTVAVARDIVAVAERNQLLVQSVTETEAPIEVATENGRGAGADEALLGPLSLEEEAARNTVSHRFELEATGTYEQMKQMLRDMERNAYPLRLVALDFNADAQSTILSFIAVIETYALKFE